MRAIDADACESYFWEHLDDNAMAGAMNAINDMPTIEPEPCKDAVKREDVQSIAEKSDWFESSDSFNDFMRSLYELPPAQPVIQCKDCKHYKALDYTDILACHYVFGCPVIRNLDDFCSRAERKDAE